MGTLTRHVLDRALDEAVALRRAGWPVPVAVNLSASDLLDCGLVDVVADGLGRRALPGAALHLEITESLAHGGPRVSDTILRRLRGLGVQIAVDDFGTGYSSLAYLRDLPVDVLKIDRSFVDQLHGDARTPTIVASTIALAHDLGLHVVAEGVETADQLDWLLRHGCDRVQGYHLGRPMTPDRLHAWLAGRERAAAPAEGLAGGPVRASVVPEPRAGRDAPSPGPADDHGRWCAVRAAFPPCESPRRRPSMTHRSDPKGWPDPPVHPDAASTVRHGRRYVGETVGKGRSAPEGGHVLAAGEVRSAVAAPAWPRPRPTSSPPSPSCVTTSHRWRGSPPRSPGAGAGFVTLVAPGPARRRRVDGPASRGRACRSRRGVDLRARRRRGGAGCSSRTAATDQRFAANPFVQAGVARLLRRCAAGQPDRPGPRRRLRHGPRPAPPRRPRPARRPRGSRPAGQRPAPARRQRVEQRAQRDVLEAVASGEALTERARPPRPARREPRVTGPALLGPPARRRRRHAARRRRARACPLEYRLAIDGLRSGDGVGSCGTAVHRRERGRRRRHRHRSAVGGLPRPRGPARPRVVHLLARARRRRRRPRDLRDLPARRRRPSSARRTARSSPTSATSPGSRSRATARAAR